MNIAQPDNILDRKVWVIRQSINHEKSLLQSMIGDEIWDALGFVFEVPTYYSIATSKKYGISMLTESENETQAYYVFQSWWYDQIRQKGPHFCDKFRFTAEDSHKLRDCLATLAARTIVVCQNMETNESVQQEHRTEDQARNFYREDFGRFLAALLRQDGGN